MPEQQTGRVPLQCNVDAELRDAIDAFAAALEKRNGTPVSRSSAMEVLLRSGLNLRANARTR